MSKPPRITAIASLLTVAMLMGSDATEPTRALAQAQDQAEPPPQTILPPGVYLLQTRTRSGTCGDAPRTGYVTSALATMDGVPGSRTMTLKVMNSKWWPKWTLTVTPDDTIVATANMFGGKDPTKGTSRFELRAHKDRFQGKGTREYPNHSKGPDEPARCSLLYDALLKQVE